MIAIRGSGSLEYGLESGSGDELYELLLAGDKHWDRFVSNIFATSRQLAAQAVSENSKPSLVVSALLYPSCQILASGSLQAGEWSGDTLLETGTYDWLATNFGEEVAETIRLQQSARRYLATVLPDYFEELPLLSQRSFFSEGGYMTTTEKMFFCQHRFHGNAVKLASWIDRGADRWLDVPDMQFFLPFVASTFQVHSR